MGAKYPEEDLEEQAFNVVATLLKGLRFKIITDLCETPVQSTTCFRYSAM